MESVMEPVSDGGKPPVRSFTKSIWWRWGGPAGLFLGVFLIPLHFRLQAAFWDRLMDAAHVPAFAAATWFLQRRWPVCWTERRRVALSFGLATFTGGMVEILQHWTGREASWGDCLNSTAGAFLFVVLHLAWSRAFWMRVASVVYAGLICAAAILPAWRLFGGIAWRLTHFPVLADFESMAEFRLWWAIIPWDNHSGASVVPSTNYASHGTQSARIHYQLIGGYPGTRLYLSDQDWRPYSTLAFDVFNPGEPFALSLRVDDSLPSPAFTDRYNGAFPLAHGWNHIRVPVATIQKAANVRPLDLTAIRRLIFFLDQPKEERVIYLDWIRLE